jgi:tetratricopeptide (TPR) repeat protein
MAARVAASGTRAGPGGLPAQGGAWPVCTGEVPPIAEAFTVRTDSVPGIEAVLSPGAVVALVSGPKSVDDPGGWGRACGKTQIAAYLAGGLQRSRKADLLAWVNASSRASVLSGYMEAAAQLGLDHDGAAEPAAARFLGWLAATARPWLLVLDDVRDPADLDGLLPGGPAGVVLVTAAHTEVLAGWEQAVTVPVPAFSPRESMAYLFDRLTTDPEQRSGAYDLAEHLCGEPSALAQAGAVMADSDTGCRDYQRHFARQWERLRAAAGRVPPAAAVTWLLSADYAEELLPGGGTWPLLLLAALLDGHGIPRAVLTAPAACRYLAGTADGSPPDRQRAQSALAALERAGLVCAGLAVLVGAPLQAAARAAAPAELLGRAVRAGADAVLETWPDGQPRSTLAAQMRACAASLLRHGGDMLWDGGSCHRVLLTAGQSLTAARLTGPAVAWWREIAARCERLLGGGHPDTLIAAGQLADALLAAGQAADAVHCSRWVRDGRDRVLGPDHPAAVAAMISLGRALAACGDAGEALTVLREAAARSERAHDSGDPGAMAALDDEYAAAFLAAGDAATAVRFCQRSLAAREKTSGREDPAALAAGERLAAACVAAGQFRDAVAQYEKVLARRDRALGPDHPDTIAAVAGLAGACAAAGRLGDALQRYQQASAGYEQALGPGNPATLACQGELARAYYDVGQVSDAAALLRAAIATATQALSPDDPATRALRDLLADITDDMTAR